MKDAELVAQSDLQASMVVRGEAADAEADDHITGTVLNDHNSAAE